MNPNPLTMQNEPTAQETMTTNNKTATAKKKGRKRSFAFDKAGSHLYGDRNQAVVLAARFARELGHNVGVGEDEQGQPVLYIDLPTGQVSWHLKHERIQRILCMFPRYKGQWDGHTRLKRWKRICGYLRQPLSVKLRESFCKFKFLFVQ